MTKLGSKGKPKFRMENDSSTQNFSSWMTDLPDALKNLPISKLAIPGSHNSFTFSLNKNGPVGPDEEALVQKLAKNWFTRKLTKYIIYRWARCQRSNVKEQLESGIRYFDIRIGRIPKTDQLCILHGLYGLEIQSILNDVNKFLTANPEEVVILDFQHFYDLDPGHHDQLVSVMQKTFGKKLCNFVLDMSKLSLSSMTTSGAQVIVVYAEAEQIEKYPFLWPRSSCPNPWANTMNIDRLSAFLNNGLKVRNRSKFFVSQAIVTPQIKTVIKHPFSTLKSIVQPCNYFLRSNWLPNLNHKTDEPNIIMTDFIGENQCVPLILSINSK